MAWRGAIPTRERWCEAHLVDKGLVHQNIRRRSCKCTARSCLLLPAARHHRQPPLQMQHCNNGNPYRISVSSSIHTHAPDCTVYTCHTQVPPRHLNWGRQNTQSFHIQDFGYKMSENRDTRRVWPSVLKPERACSSFNVPPLLFLSDFLPPCGCEQAVHPPLQ